MASLGKGSAYGGKAEAKRLKNMREGIGCMHGREDGCSTCDHLLAGGHDCEECNRWADAIFMDPAED